ncbi:MAG: cyclic nucleotide-binding domain-containing protein [Nocardioidaceae bacterium]
MHVQGCVTAVSWIPSEAVTGLVYRVPFSVGLSHYDATPPTVLPPLDEFLAADRARFVNRLQAWIEVRDGVVVEYSHEGAGHIGSTTLRLAGAGMTFAAVPLPDRRTATRVSDTAVRFEQTAGGRTGVPAPRRVSHPPYVQLAAPLAWSTLSLTLHADGTQEYALVGASPFPRHWVYDHEHRLRHKSATIDYREWSTHAFGRHTPWGDTDSPALVAEVETALEHELADKIMRGGVRPQIRRLSAGDLLTQQHDEADELYLLLDGVLQVDVDGTPVAEVGPGALLGERAVLESGRRTATLVALTPCTIAAAHRDTIETDLLHEVSKGHRREEQS